MAEMPANCQRRGAGISSSNRDQAEDDEQEEDEHDADEDARAGRRRLAG
jgi:hypothetical protein